MHEDSLDNIIEEQDDFSLENILAEFKSEAFIQSERRTPSQELDEQAREIVSVESEESEEPDGPERAPEPAAPEPEPIDETDELFRADVQELFSSRRENAAYAAPDAAPEPEPEPPRQRRPRPRTAPSKPKRSAMEAIAEPLVAILACAQIKRQQRAAQPPAENEPAPEVAPARAARHYAAQAKPLSLRVKLAAAVCVVLAWITYGLPMAGALGWSVQMQAGVSLILELLVMVLGLDVLTAGILSLADGKPGAESLVALACLFTAADAFAIFMGGGVGAGLPFCAPAALSMTCAMWGSRLTCSGFAATFRTLASSKSPFCITAEPDVLKSGHALMRSQRDLFGFVRRSEAPDVCEKAYAVASPLLMALCAVLALMDTILGRSGATLLHVLSSLLAVSAPFTCLLSFALPFCVTARKLRQSGAAVAGSSGAAEVGRSRRVIITDSDLFPSGTVSVAGVRVLEGMFTDAVVSYTGSLLAASGCGLAEVFSDLIYRKGYTLLKVENFRIHEGGGLSGLIRGDNVMVGTSGFMNLMGVRLPQNLNLKTALFTAQNGELVGIFTLNYTPIINVQTALVNLLHGHSNPLFAVRDPLITPLMVRQKFKMPTDSFDFPSFSERYRISAVEAGRESLICAVMSRPGLGPMVEAAERGRRLWRASRICTALSLAGSVLGVVLVSLLCRAGSFDSASAGNVLTFMALWLVPTLAISLGLRR